jgi:hypothetical protein
MILACYYSSVLIIHNALQEIKTPNITSLFIDCVYVCVGTVLFLLCHRRAR